MPKGHVSQFFVELVWESLDLKEITGSYVSGLGLGTTNGLIEFNSPKCVGISERFIIASGPLSRWSLGRFLERDAPACSWEAICRHPKANARTVRLAERERKSLEFTRIYWVKMSAPINARSATVSFSVHAGRRRCSLTL